MSRSGRHKEKYRNDSDSTDEGTSARTRPFTFEDIMARRRMKELSQNVKGELGEAGISTGTTMVEELSPNLKKHTSDEVLRVSSTGRGKHASARKDKSERSTDRKSHESKGRSIKKEESASRKEDKPVTDKAKRSNGSETKSKIKLSSEVSYKHSELRYKDYRGVNDDRNSHRNKHGERLRDDHEGKERKGLRDTRVRERYDEREREKSDRESKRKQHDVEDQEIRVKTVARKRDSRRRDSEVLEKMEKEEQSHSHYGDTKMRRKRSRSRECEKGRDRRSVSLSPKAHKHVSHNGRTHQESSLDRDRTEKQHGDPERRYTSNGSSKHYHGHGGSSGLGGYSPRKRKSEKAAKTPSPINRSPERKSAGWDIPPGGAKDSDGSVPESFPSSNKAVSASVHEAVHNISAALSIMKPPSGFYNSILAIKNNASIDSIQLTESTRRMRRLYVENIPDSASEKDVMECLNNYLLSSGVNHIHGTKPCISCMMHKEKGQALVEFLTPEDASAALSFDGSSFFGSILKIRRPKDFVEVTTGYTGGTAESLKSAVTTHSMSNTVNDSPHKIFIGGISELLSPEMLIEITSAFGQLKAFHLEANENSRDRYAFLEYLDPLATLKACAGLNGMKFGGQVLTVVQAVPNPSSMENAENASLYAIPDNAKPLLQEPTQVLKLTNVFAPESLSSLSETDLEEILEDVRLECTRFGTIRSLNVIKHGTDPSTQLESLNIAKTEVSDEPEKKMDMESDGKIEEFGRNEQVDNTANMKESEAVAQSNTYDDVQVDDPIEGDTGRLDGNLDGKDLACEYASNVVSSLETDQLENASDVVSSLETDQLKNPNHQLECQGGDMVVKTQVEDVDSEEQLQESKQMDLEDGHEKSMDTVRSDGSMLIHSNALKHGDNTTEQDPNLESLFESGSVFVEYKRTENACMAAYSLHGRMFDERTISVEYIPLDLYLAKFPR